MVLDALRQWPEVLHLSVDLMYQYFQAIFNPGQTAHQIEDP